MSYWFEFNDQATQFVEEIGGNNLGSSVFCINCDGSLPVLMGTALQFYVKSDIKTIEEFFRISEGCVTAAIPHETDSSLFVLCYGSSTLNVEKQRAPASRSTRSMPYRFEFGDQATQFVEDPEIGGNNWGSGVFYIYCNGPQPVLMGMTLQDHGFYVKSDIETIEEFFRVSEGRVTAAIPHETDPSLFVLCYDSLTLNVESLARLRNQNVGYVDLY